jgi:TPP-dependent pyruvate/acetoin dehydrogenase alpha subunit
MATEVQPGAEPTVIPADAGQLSSTDRMHLLRYMLLMRGIEERAMSLYRQGKVPGSFYDGYGQEAVSAGAAFAMGPRDRLCILHRDLAAHLVRGVSPERILAQYMGRAGGVTEGREGNVHFGDRELGCVGMVSMLPDMMLVATGMAMAFKLRGEPACALTWVGDGATSRGDFHEAMNWAAVQRLPVIFVLENNQYAYSTPLSLQFAVDPLERARAYGFPGERVDGNDVEAVFEATRRARERALAGAGPTLIEAVTMRMHGHAAHDDMRYVPTALVEEWRERDPIDRQERRLTGLGLDVAALRAETSAEIDAAATAALASPMPDPATALDGVFCVEEPEPLGDGRAPWSGFEEDGDA